MVAYGTAGFRGRADQILEIAVRIGEYVGEWVEGKNDCVGIVVTASHNPPADNGVKLINSDGDMFPVELENAIEDYTNGSSGIAFGSSGAENKRGDGQLACVLIGRDTRESSSKMVELLRRGIYSKAKTVKVIDCGLLTTPQVHFLVWRVGNGDGRLREMIYQYQEGDETNGIEEFYFEEILYAPLKCFLSFQTDWCQPLAKVVLDLANGVGALKIGRLKGIIEFVQLLNGEPLAKRHLLNSECGADFVQKTRRVPRDFCSSSNDEKERTSNDTHYYSFDGDADRIVAFYPHSDGSVNVIGGDRIACLLATVISNLIDDGHNVSVGVVQTAYANGASFEYLRRSLPLVTPTIAPTGVKHLHKVAKSFDIGIYFESNGHGTVVTNPQAKLGDGKSKLERFLQLFNQTTGDAISNLLGIEIAWRLFGGCPIGMYDDLPSMSLSVPLIRNKLDKLKVKVGDEQTLEHPKYLQDQIDSALLLAKDDQVRAFVRPSGTEDICRIYVESSTLKTTCKLIEEIEKLVCGICS